MIKVNTKAILRYHLLQKFLTAPSPNREQIPIVFHHLGPFLSHIISVIVIREETAPNNKKNNNPQCQEYQEN